MLFEVGGERRRGGVAERGVGPPGIVIIGPCGDLLAGVGQAGEQRLIEQLVAHPSVEAFDEGVLGGLARRRVVPLDPALAAPFQHRVRGQLGAVIADDHARLAVHGDQLLQLTHHPLARDRGIRHRLQAFTRDIIDDVEHPEPAARDHLVVHEVEAPALVGKRRNRGGRRSANRAFATLSPPHGQPFLAIQSLHLLAVGARAKVFVLDQTTGISLGGFPRAYLG